MCVHVCNLHVKITVISCKRCVYLCRCFFFFASRLHHRMCWYQEKTKLEDVLADPNKTNQATPLGGGSSVVRLSVRGRRPTMFFISCGNAFATRTKADQREVIDATVYQGDHDVELRCQVPTRLKEADASGEAQPASSRLHRHGLKRRKKPDGVDSCAGVHTGAV